MVSPHVTRTPFLLTPLEIQSSITRFGFFGGSAPNGSEHSVWIGQTDERVRFVLALAGRHKPNDKAAVAAVGLLRQVCNSLPSPCLLICVVQHVIYIYTMYLLLCIT